MRNCWRWDTDNFYCLKLLKAGLFILIEDKSFLWSLTFRTYTFKHFSIFLVSLLWIFVFVMCLTTRNWVSKFKCILLTKSSISYTKRKRKFLSTQIFQLFKVCVCIVFLYITHAYFQSLRPCYISFHIAFHVRFINEEFVAFSMDFNLFHDCEECLFMLHLHFVSCIFASHAFFGHIYFLLFFVSTLF